MVNIDIQKSNKCNGEASLFISFPYNDKILAIIRSYPSRFWHADKKVWEVPASKLADFTERVEKYSEAVVTGNLDLLKVKESVTNIDFNFKTTPFNHQIEGFMFGLNHDKWLLADEQGLGKTKQVIDIAVKRKADEGLKHCLIICCVNGLKWNWKNEVSTHSNESAHILGERYKKGKSYVGTTADKLDDARHIDELPYFIITNVETLRNEDVCEALTKACKNGEIGMIAVDEVHKCKNPTAQQSKGLFKLSSHYHIAMTGTPIMNSPLDLFVILKWLGYEKHSFYAFRNHYCTMGGYGGYEIVGYKNIDELEEATRNIMLRRLKEDVLDLPDKLYIDEFVEMTGKQEQIYKEVTAEIKSNIDQIKMASNPLAELIRMRQATGYTGILSSTIKESAKIERLKELVEEATQNGKKVVVFSNWTQMTAPVNEALKNYGTVVITGETPVDERQRLVKAFQEDENYRIAIGTIGAMGTGLTLTAGTVVIFMDEPWTMANKQQAIDRCHRIGTTSNITVYTLMCKDTIDERIHNIVEKKGALSDALIDGKIVGDKTELLNYLLG